VSKFEKSNFAKVWHTVALNLRLFVLRYCNMGVECLNPTVSFMLLVYCDVKL